MIQFTPKDPDFEKRVQDSFARQKFMTFIHARLNKIEPGFCEIEIPFSENISQQHGFFHAGIIGTVADNAAGYAAYSLMSKTSSILTVEFKLNLISPADGELLIGNAHVLKYGRTLTICRSDVYSVKNGIRKLCAASQSTLIELPEHNDKRN
ncbi:MAG: PaaI family thioesterase [Bacteroidetes bacterium]|nr:PaaI family thioesterase [Bacteroidota bacterium]